MCAPISVTTSAATGGAVNTGAGCVGVCQVMPQILASLGIVGVLLWGFRGAIKRRLSFRRAG